MRRRDLLKTGSGAALGLWAASSLSAAATEEPNRKRGKKRILYFTKSVGYEHSVVQRRGGELSHSERVLTEMGKRSGFEVVCTKDGEVFDQDLDRYDAVAFYTAGDLTQAGPDGGRPMTRAGKGKLLDFISGGRGFIGFHACTDSFRSTEGKDGKRSETDPYIAMLGGEFVTHGEQQEASLFIADRFPGIRGLGCAEAFSFHEEWYTLRNFARDLHVILVQETRHMHGECYQRPPYPCTWARLHGKGRVFYTSLGHREDIWTDPFFQAVALGGIGWALGDIKAEVKPNFNEVTPRANELTGPPA
ncbi:MAG: ThuA domain-containing protein [Phycisphaerae bacterium]|nr:ThuA domain-containing protein [Phycisphaerae bacterium]